MQSSTMRKDIRHEGDAVRGRSLARALSAGLLSLLLLGSSSSLAAQQPEETGRQQLERAFAELRAQPTDSLKQRTFFQASPETFTELQECFAFNRFKPEELDYTAYLDLFRKMNFVSVEEKMERLFSLMVCGYWQADATCMHFDLMRELMLEDPERAFALVSKENKARQILFWQCFWQEPEVTGYQAQRMLTLRQAKGYEAEKRIMLAAYEDFRGVLPVVD